METARIDQALNFEPSLELERDICASINHCQPGLTITVDLTGQPVFCNPAARKLSEDLGLSLVDILPARHEETVRNCFEAGFCAHNLEVTLRGRVFAWTYRSDHPLGLVHIFGHDITRRKQAERELLHLATHDNLTGLPNRSLFLDRLEVAVSQAAEEQSGYRFAVLYLDLDQFKLINDTLGHEIGDGVLREVAQRISGVLDHTDMIARLGGDEFAILLEDISDLIGPIHIADRIREVLHDPVLTAGQELFITASIGIVLSNKHHTRPDHVLRDADQAMYRAKTDGKARFAMFDEDMHKKALELLTLGADLRRALDRGEFMLFYQPLVKLGSFSVDSYEALLRWRHPTDGMIPPNQFIPLAEESGLIVAIGDWVLLEACRQVIAWDKVLPDKKLRIAVNLSAKQFRQHELTASVRRALNESGLAPHRLKLEVTESVVMDNAQEAAEILAELKSLGVTLAIDDFGTGYSSLSYLQRFPIDTLKIDRSFVSKMQPGTSEVEIVRAIVQLAHSLDLDVVAEGAESLTQIVMLKGLSCDRVQGFYFSKPLPPEEAIEMARDTWEMD